MSDHSVSQPLNIAVVGGGNIGSAFAFYLAQRGGNNLTIVARPNSARLEQLERDGGVINENDELVVTKVSERLDENIAYDVVIVTVLAHQVDTILPVLQRSKAKLIQFMFTTFNPEYLKETVGPSRTALGMPFMQSRMDSTGRVKINPGSGRRPTLTSDSKLAEIFNAAGIPSREEMKMCLWLRCHVPLCVAFESVAVSGVHRGGGAYWRDAYKLAVGIRACFELIRSQGYEIYPGTKVWIDTLPITVIASMLWGLSRVSDFREVLAQGKMECISLVDSMLNSIKDGAVSVEEDKIAAMKQFW